MARVSSEELERRQAEQAAKGPTLVIKVNGKSRFWNGARISYDNIVRDIVCEHVGNRNALHTVTYAYRKGTKPPGTLAPGQDIEAESGMIFNATVTGNG